VCTVVQNISQLRFGTIQTHIGALWTVGVVGGAIAIQARGAVAAPGLVGPLAPTIKECHQGQGTPFLFDLTKTTRHVHGVIAETVHGGPAVGRGGLFGSPHGSARDTQEKEEPGLGQTRMEGMVDHRFPTTRPKGQGWPSDFSAETGLEG
jgi:hypothetical protein